MEKRQASAPLFEALLRHRDQSRGNFHVPGHKQGQAFDADGIDWFGKLLTIDLTEVGELDDLHQAEGAIREAQGLAAEAFGAEQTFFLTGGSTAGNLSLVLALCRPGERLIVQRDSHQSVFNGCSLAGVRPVYLSGEIDPVTGELSRLRPEDMAEALRRYPDARGVFITSPDYFGRVQRVKELASVCHRHGIPLLVDEAHGAHFSFHPTLPPSAMQSGADAAVQSTHKMLPAMTMASMLHLRGTRVNREGAARWLRTLQSSSPSYPLLASLDLARRWMVERGRLVLDNLLPRLAALRERIDGLELLGEAATDDPLKLSIRAENGVAGFRLLQWLNRRGVYPELADHRRVLAVFSVGTSGADLRNLGDRLTELDRASAVMPPGEETAGMSVPVLSESRLSLADTAAAGTRDIPLDDCIGRVAAEMVVPYPPGIPLVLPGEVYTPERVQAIRGVLGGGGRVRGLRAGFPPRVDVLQ